MSFILAKFNDEVYQVLVDEADVAWLNRYKWRVSTNGYAYRNTSIRKRGKKHPWNYRVWMHRQIMGLSYKHRRVVDHINEDKLDNRRTNLQRVTQAKNVKLSYERRMAAVDARRPAASRRMATC